MSWPLERIVRGYEGVACYRVHTEVFKYMAGERGTLERLKGEDCDLRGREYRR